MILPTVLLLCLLAVTSADWQTPSMLYKDRYYISCHSTYVDTSTNITHIVYSSPADTGGEFFFYRRILPSGESTIPLRMSTRPRPPIHCRCRISGPGDGKTLYALFNLAVSNSFLDGEDNLFTESGSNGDSWTEAAVPRSDVVLDGQFRVGAALVHTRSGRLFVFYHKNCQIMIASRTPGSLVWSKESVLVTNQPMYIMSHELTATVFHSGNKYTLFIGAINHVKDSKEMPAMFVSENAGISWNVYTEESHRYMLSEVVLADNFVTNERKIYMLMVHDGIKGKIVLNGTILEYNVDNRSFGEKSSVEIPLGDTLYKLSVCSLGGKTAIYALFDHVHNTQLDHRRMFRLGMDNGANMEKMQVPYDGTNYLEGLQMYCGWKGLLATAVNQLSVLYGQRYIQASVRNIDA